MLLFTSLLSLAVAAQAAAVPSSESAGILDAVLHDSAGGQAKCITGKIPVKASTPDNIKLNFALPKNQTDVTETFVDMLSSGSTLMKRVVGSKHTVSGTYNISSTICVPKSGSDATKAQSIQFLTHGIGVSKSYWDFAKGYSYADVAAANGYPTFFYDRLGVGSSEKPDPIQVVQAPLEVAIAYSLIEMLRSGKIGKTTYSKVVGVGHSFGSFITVGLASQFPTSIDAAILTGFSVNSTAVDTFLAALDLQIAAENQPKRFKGLSTGYLVTQGQSSNQFDFFRAPGFPPANLVKATATKGAVTFGELFTMTTIAKPAPKFTGPVAVVNGANDYPFCSGNCKVPSNLLAQVKPALFKNVKKFQTYLGPDAGHALNLHYAADGAFKFIQKFLASSGM